MPTLYIRGEKYSGSIDSHVRIVQEISNDAASVPSSAVLYALRQKMDEEFARYVCKFVDELPATGITGTIYLVAHEHDSSDTYDEYIWLESESRFEKIGHVDIDLSEYAKTADFKEISADDINTMWANT